MKLDKWEHCFSLDAGTIGPMDKAGALLKLIPPRSRWEEYVADVQADWDQWSKKLESYPYCLLVLFGGVAFYKYDDNTFWPPFMETLNTQLSAGQQSSV